MEYINKEFEASWQGSLDEIQGIAQIEHMKKSYFTHLLKIFKCFNPFIIYTGSDSEYE